MALSATTKLLMAALLASAAASATARTAADFFTEAPQAVLPLLDRNARLDMLDYYRHKLPTTTSNLFNGAARVLEEHDNSIEVQLSRDAGIQFALVPVKNDTVIAIIETVLTPVADSGVTFYRTDWTPIKNTPALPSATAFFPKEKRKEVKDTDMPEPLYMRISFDPAKGLFRFTNTSGANYTSVDRPEGLAAMRHSIDMRFDGKRFIETTSTDED